MLQPRPALISSLFLSTCLLISAPSTAEPTALSAGLSVDQLEISGVTLVQSSEQLRNRLGAPIASHTTVDRETGEAARIEIYRGLTAYLVAGEAMRLKTTDPEMTTAAGARVGDSVEKVLSLYAPSRPEIRNPGRVELRVAGSRASLVFHTYRDRVTAIEVLLDYS